MVGAVWVPAYCGPQCPVLWYVKEEQKECVVSPREESTGHCSLAPSSLGMKYAQFLLLGWTQASWFPVRCYYTRKGGLWVPAH